jgi:NAD(P)-dependent dehydrogenase (short-subunit alcohol dehydrogenase family)
MGNRLADRVAIVTGAGRGLGEQIARAYCREGARVVLTARTDNEIQGVTADLSAEEGSALAVSGDVTDEADVRAVFSRAREAFGPVDILVNNAGANQLKPFTETTVEEWDRILTTNLRGAFLCVREALTDMVPRRSGVILNISSSFGSQPCPNFTAYCASKFGLEGFTRALAIEMKSEGIRVNTLHPGGVCDTTIGAATAPPDLPREQWLSADILCDPAVFLASEEGRSVTGQCIDAKGWLKGREAGVENGDEAD